MHTDRNGISERPIRPEKSPKKCGFRKVGVSSEKVIGFRGKVRGFPKQKPAIGKSPACAYLHTSHAQVRRRLKMVGKCGSSGCFLCFHSVIGSGRSDPFFSANFRNFIRSAPTSLFLPSVLQPFRSVCSLSSRFVKLILG